MRGDAPKECLPVGAQVGIVGHHEDTVEEGVNGRHQRLHLHQEIAYWPLPVQLRCEACSASDPRDAMALEGRRHLFVEATTQMISRDNEWSLYGEAEVGFHDAYLLSQEQH